MAAGRGRARRRSPGGKRLIVELVDLPPELDQNGMTDASMLPGGDPVKRPYVTLPLYRLLRACERFGLPPWGLDEPGCPPTVKAAVLEYDRIRSAEEAALERARMNHG